ncbi:TRAP transporter small permease [Devosia psychrophila]|uniref:TRAP transporter small permease protein n=1 Tax=Devosia psychrophila TaxID=728005 RepID=A0A0F5Q029_9HYPH|nr:TRAP transporter small permease subunit [Devosia psychrophila]KKC34006.1 C4-dicarboxylate ABC transporter permease [Devosia psychrophila]SFD41477.1 TRAP-type C4-dicarboxylate transport system, small permease component [Devosia psychrophila]
MNARFAGIGAWLHARAENLLAAMLAVMFTVFILQIFFRYVVNFPVGWTHEISVIMWLWMVLFGTAFVVRDNEEIRFDILYSAVSDRWRRVLVVASAVMLIVLFGISLPAVIDYVMFMKVEKTAYLKIRFDWLYSIYAIFAVATIVRQFWLGYQAIWGKGTEEYDPTKVSSGV